jgi:hypothetical protein
MKAIGRGKTANVATAPIDVIPATTALTELRRRMIEKSLNPFRISLGNRRVYTTFAIELKTLR